MSWSLSPFLSILYSTMSKDLSVGDLVDDDFISILVGKKCHINLWHTTGHKPTMNDFGSNKLVPHVHVLYLNVGTKWTKNQAWGPNLTHWWPPSMANWLSECTIMMGLAYDGYLQKMGLIGHNWPVGRPMNVGEISSNLVWSKPRERWHSPHQWSVAHLT